MQGHQRFTEKVVTQFRLSECVPKHTLYRRLRELLSWEIRPQQTRAVYSRTGQPAPNPVVFSACFG